MTLRLAGPDDIPAIAALIPRSARALQRGDYTAAQIEGALGTVFAVDARLIHDGTYFVVEDGGQVVACGGWSGRAALFGGDAGRADADDPRLDPARDPARVRAFFVDPAYARRGIGGRLIAACEDAARAAGFRRAELVATLTGEPLYAAAGYGAVERYAVDLPNSERLPVVRMAKAL